MDRNYKKGFTLIELLVVIAIIGILSAVVLASLNQARGRAADASIQSNLKTVQTQSMMFYDTTGGQTYGTSTTGSCTTSGSMFADATIAQAINTAQRASPGTATCRSDGQNWAMSVPLKDATGHWCVDWRGAAHRTASAVSGNTCPAAAS